MIRIVWFAAGLALAVPVATAEEYWIAYEGNDFPENEGWVRSSVGTPAERWLEDGSLFIDSRADLHTTENYTIYFDGGLDPGPAETFIMRSKLNVHDVYPWEDPGVYVISDDLWTVTFLFGDGYLLSVYEPNVSANFKPGVFHEFELRSADMRNYELYIDSALAIEGAFFEGLFSTCAGWGDIVGGGASLAEWDYFRFGVVPEPRTGLLFSISLLAARSRA